MQAAELFDLIKLLKRTNTYTTIKLQVPQIAYLSAFISCYVLHDLCPDLNRFQWRIHRAPPAGIQSLCVTQ